jgi:hypothetical protein
MKVENVFVLFNNKFLKKFFFKNQKNDDRSPIDRFQKKVKSLFFRK